MLFLLISTLTESTTCCDCYTSNMLQCPIRELCAATFSVVVVACRHSRHLFWILVERESARRARQRERETKSERNMLSRSNRTCCKRHLPAFDQFDNNWEECSMMIDDGWGHGNSNNVLCQQLWCQKWQQSNNNSAHVVTDNTNVFSQRQRQQRRWATQSYSLPAWAALQHIT